MSKTDKRKELAKKIAATTTKNFGHRTGFVASDLSDVELNVTSTGILALDYATGIGGFPSGFATHIFGPPDIGKSSTLALGGIREAQKAGKLCGLIAMEPSFDEGWAVKHGVDPELLVVAYPDSAEDSFGILHEWVNAGVPDFIVFDSIGALVQPTKEEGKVKAYGASGLISANMNEIAPRIYKRDISLILLNQIRDDTNAQIPGLVKPPGGHALKHVSPLWIQLKPGKERYYTQIGTGKSASKLLAGRRVIAQITRNKLAERSAPGFKAQFDFYNMETDEYQLGIDKGFDVITTGLLSGVIKGSGWYEHPSFNVKNHKLNGQDKIDEYIREHPESFEAIRKDVLATLNNDQPIYKPDLEEVVEEVEDDG